MKICPKCARMFTDAADYCEKCDRALIDADSATAKNMPDEELRKKRRNDWATIIIGVPLLMLVIYAIYRIMLP